MMMTPPLRVVPSNVSSSFLLDSLESGEDLSNVFEDDFLGDEEDVLLLSKTPTPRPSSALQTELTTVTRISPNSSVHDAASAEFSRSSERQQDKIPEATPPSSSVPSPPPPPVTPPLLPLTDAPPGYVNVYLWVDPASNRVVLPQQLLTAKIGDATSTALCGPAVLPNFDAATIQGLANNNGGSVQQAEKTRQPAAAVTPRVRPLPASSALPVAAIPAATETASPTILPPPPPSQQQQSSSQRPSPPVRALSAYNFFFRNERDRILRGGAGTAGTEEYDFSASRRVELLREHWERDRTRKRRHRKTHGKIAFTDLSKLIGRRWKALPEGGRQFFRDVASQDWERYQRELQRYRLMTETATTTMTQSQQQQSVPATNNVFTPVVG